MKISMNKLSIALFGISVLVVSLFAWTYTRANGETIQVCVKKSGVMYVVGEGFKKDECKKNEQLLSLGVQGWDEARIAALEARVAALENPTPPPPPVSCTAVLCQNFNSYLDGSIIGQDDWFDRENGTRWIIQNSIVQEGLKALSNFNPSGESIITKNTGTALADGRQSFYVRPENRSNWSSYHVPNFQLGMFQGSWDGSSRITVGFGIDGQASYINASTDTRVNFGAYNDNAWNLLDIEWRSSDKTARYKLNNGLWTDWIPFTGGAAFTGFDTVGLDGANLGTGGVYVDNLH